MKKCIQCGYKNEDRASSCNLCSKPLSSFKSPLGGGGGPPSGDPNAEGTAVEPRLWAAGKPRRLTER